MRALFFGIMMLISSTASAAPPSPAIPGFPTCPELQFQNGSFVPGDHASHHGPNDYHGIIGNILPDGTVLPGNVQGVDDVYTDPNNPDQFVQCYCGTDTRTIIVNGVPQTLYGWGIQTQWRVANSCSEATGDEICAPFGCNWNIPYYSGCFTAGCCQPAIALHSNLYPCHPWCGDGTLQPDEECDDGNRTDGDGCSANCEFEQICGNGVVEQGEACDDGNQVDTDACTNNCEMQEVCTDIVDNDGDGLIDCVDPDCECGDFKDDPAKLIFKTNGLDQFKVSGIIKPDQPFDPLPQKICFLLANETQGAIWSECLEPGSFSPPTNPTRPKWRYRNTMAKTLGGLYQVSIGGHGGPGYYIVRVRAYDNVPDVTDLTLTMQVVIGDVPWAQTGLWTRRGSSIRFTFGRI